MFHLRHVQAIIKHCRDRNIYYHTYQLKEERAFRVVIKHLHYSTDLDDITTELGALGHTVRNIINVQNRLTKEPMNLFYVDLEPANNNKDIYGITAIQNKLIQIEPPQSTKPQIPQCLRCQSYGHTRKYCNMPYKCVKCGGHHNSTLCTKPRDSPAKCALCGGPHPANYKWCEQYRSILKGHNPHMIPPPLHEDFPPFLPYFPQIYRNRLGNREHNAATRTFWTATNPLLMTILHYSKPS